MKKFLLAALVLLFGTSMYANTDRDCTTSYPYLETFDVNEMDCWSNIDKDSDGHLWKLAEGHEGMGVKSVSSETTIYEYEEPKPVPCDPITTFPYFNEFEDFLTNHDCWIDIDNDGDGQTWLTGTAKYGAEGWGVDSSNCLVSQSYDNFIGEFNADNYLLSPEFELPSTVIESFVLSWYERSQDPGCPDNYEVMIAPNGSTDINDFVSIYSGTAANPWTARTADISAYLGQTIRVVFHHQSYDCFMLEIDNMSIYEGYAQCDPITEYPYFNNFDNFTAEHDCWIDIDNDGDGQTWFTGTADYGIDLGIDGSTCLASLSYDNNIGSFNADNYLVSPEFELPTTVEEALVLSWFEQSQDASYPDSYEVMIAPNGSTEISDFVSIYSGVAANPWTERTFDISSYAGQTIRVVFHHQSSDCYMLEIDNMSIYDGQGPEPVDCDPITDFPYFNNFDNFTAEHDCWIDIDNDGDGQTWLTGTAKYGTMGWGIDGSNCLISESYGISGALNADNYLLSPEFELPSTETEIIVLSWYEQSQEAAWLDNYEVMIAPNGSTNIKDFVSIYSGTAADSWTARVANLSAYSGQTIRVVFNHQSYDGYMLKIDNMVIDVLGGINGINDINGNEFTVYPNPVKNTLNINGVEPGTAVRIYDVTGSEVMSFVYEGQNINVEGLANGVYILRAGDSTIKIVK